MEDTVKASNQSPMKQELRIFDGEPIASPTDHLPPGRKKKFLKGGLMSKDGMSSTKSVQQQPKYGYAMSPKMIQKSFASFMLESAQPASNNAPTSLSSGVKIRRFRHLQNAWQMARSQSRQSNTQN